MLKSMFRPNTLILLLTLATLAACKKDDDTEQELITTIQLHVTGPNGFDQRFEWEDLDGDGGNNPVIDTIVLPANADYSCKVYVLNRSVTPEEDITVEIREENLDHLLLYNVILADLLVSSQDNDDAGLPLRLLTDWTTGNASIGTLRIRLLHEADKSAADPAATGETDFDVTFPVVIQ
jgi:hypothetical protein